MSVECGSSTSGQLYYMDQYNTYTFKYVASRDWIDTLHIGSYFFLLVSPQHTGDIGYYAYESEDCSGNSGKFVYDDLFYDVT